MRIMGTWRERMRAKRKAADLTQDQLGEILDREQGTISDWETGRREPETLQMFEKLADAIHCHPAWLLYAIDTDVITEYSGLEEHEQRAIRAAIHSLFNGGPPA